jgi:hypothetical protein
MSRSINGRYTLAYPNLLGFQELTSDSITDKTTGHSVFYDITDLETHSALISDITIGTNNANTITVNSGHTTYNNNETITLKDNTVGALKFQFNDVGQTDLMSINTINGSEKVVINKNFQVMGDLDAINVYCSTINTTADINSNGFKDSSITDSTSVISGGIVAAGGMGIGKSCCIGCNLTVTGGITSSHIVSTGSIQATGSVQAVGIASTGNINCYANTIYGGSIIISGAIYCGTLSPQNILLPTSGGTASSLNYYEESMTSIALAPSIGGAYVYNNNVYIIRIGKLVTLRIPAFSGNALGGYMIASSTSGIPLRFRPPTKLIFAIPIMMSNGTSAINQIDPGQLMIYSTGEIRIYSSCGGNGVFTSGVGSGILSDIVVSWTMY